VVSTLIEVLIQTEAPYFNREAASALAVLGPDAKKAVPELLAARKSFDIELRKAANEALKKIDPETFYKIGASETK